MKGRFFCPRFRFFSDLSKSAKSPEPSIFQAKIKPAILENISQGGLFRFFACKHKGLPTFESSVEDLRKTVDPVSTYNGFFDGASIGTIGQVSSAERQRLLRAEPGQ